MGKILISAFIAFAVVAVALIPNRDPDQLIVEQVLMSQCKQSFHWQRRTSGRPDGELDQACRCGVDAMIKHLTPDIASLSKALSDGKPLPPKTEWLLKREYNVCLVKHKLPLE